MASRVAFLGLGVMGFPMAGHLARGGHEVKVYNRTASKAEAWLETYKGSKALTAAEAAISADVVFACVGTDDDLREVTTGRTGAFAAMKEGTIFVDHTTVSAQVTRELDDLARSKGIKFLDGPVSGGQAGAEDGQLTVMMGGEQTDFDEVRPLIDCFAKMVKLMGPAGSGQLTKMVNQICIAGVVQGLSEALYFAEKVGLDTADVVDVISKGAAQSWQMENRHETMHAREFEHGFAVDWMRKDLGIVLDRAGEAGLILPLTKLVDQFYADIQDMGGNRWDTSSLIARLDHVSKDR